MYQISICAPHRHKTYNPTPAHNLYMIVAHVAGAPVAYARTPEEAKRVAYRMRDIRPAHETSADNQRAFMEACRG